MTPAQKSTSCSPATPDFPLLAKFASSHEFPQLDYPRHCLRVWLTDDCMPRQSNVSSQRADAAGGRQVMQGAAAPGLVRVSAGELLGRTHEELVLLLIQLRRQNATVLKAMDTCHMEIEAQVR